jgi:UDP-N-acetylmuramyl pentapeptide phosphotransferase/UDP-N-acetylglucosamine-1-phosphate transferase
MSYILSLLIAVVILLSGVWIFRKMKVMDKPGSDLKNTRQPVPTILGVFVYVGFLAIIGILFPHYYSQPLFLGLVV